ncbi:MAG: hypothetical protein WD354_01485 [Acidimicrobiia bacterium]
MRLRWIYLGLMVALAITAFVFQRLGSTEVASHSFGHLVFAAGVMALVWFIPRPVSAPNRWLWRGGWAVSAAFWKEALGAFGYDDRATSALPGLYFVHTAAPIVLLPALLIVIGSACALAWSRLPRPAAVGVVAVLSMGSLFLISTAIGLGP